MIIMTPDGSVHHVRDFGDYPKTKVKKPKKNLLEGIKVGDIVNHINPWMNRSTPHKVAKVSKTLVWLDHPDSYLKFRLSDGCPPKGTPEFCCYIRKSRRKKIK